MKINPLSNSNVSFGILHLLNSGDPEHPDSADNIAKYSDAESFKSAQPLLTTLSQLPEDVYVKAREVRNSYRKGLGLELYTDSKGEKETMLAAFTYEKGASEEQHRIWGEKNKKQLDDAISRLRASKVAEAAEDYARRFCEQFKK